MLKCIQSYFSPGVEKAARPPEANNLQRWFADSRLKTGRQIYSSIEKVQTMLSDTRGTINYGGSSRHNRSGQFMSPRLERPDSHSPEMSAAVSHITS
jgi:hypothetical protein